MKQVTLLFLRRKGEVLLAMKKRGFGMGKWNGVGGKVEPGESVVQAATRECQEEIGITPIHPQLVGRLQFYMAHDPDFHHDCHVFVADAWEGEPTESEEMRPQWFAHADIPFAHMWADDELWFPHFLAGTPFMGDVVIAQQPDGDSVASHTIATVAAIT